VLSSGVARLFANLIETFACASEFFFVPVVRFGVGHQDVRDRGVVSLEIAVGLIECHPVLHAVAEAGHDLLGVVQE
jgi:hypothetical protein